MWRERAEYVARRLKEYLWREERGACFDRDKTGAFTETLIHNNLRCMYHGVFSADMAARFVREHLLDPEEFYTPFPLPSIAANDPSFRDLGENNWSGQPQSLTYQRALFALEKYGYLSLAEDFAKKYLRVMKEYKLFVQQFDPFLAKPTMASHDGYGPAVLNVLAFTSHFYGVFKRRESMVWTGSEGEYSFEQRIGERRYLLAAEKGQMAGFLNGEELFRVRTGVRVVTDEAGRVLSLIGVEGGEVRLTKNGHTMFEGALSKDGAVQLAAQ